MRSAKHEATRKHLLNAVTAKSPSTATLTEALQAFQSVFQSFPHLSVVSRMLTVRS